MVVVMVVVVLLLLLLLLYALGVHLVGVVAVAALVDVVFSHCHVVAAAAKQRPDPNSEL